MVGETVSQRAFLVNECACKTYRLTLAIKPYPVGSELHKDPIYLEPFDSPVVDVEMFILP